MPEELVVTAESEDGEVMAVEHKEYPIFGLQFHPESVMTPDGKTDDRELYKCCKSIDKEETKMIKEAIIKLSKKQDLTYDRKQKRNE